MASAASVAASVSVPDTAGVEPDGPAKHLGWGKSPDCPPILELHPDHRFREWTAAEQQHIQGCPFCQSWIRKFTAAAAEADTSASVGELLESVGAIERDAPDYELPSRLLSDTYVNVSKLCASEDAVARVAAAFDHLFADTSFDVIVVNGWQLAMVARRLAARRRLDIRSGIPVVISEDYTHLSFKEDILPQKKVLVLVDTVVTGNHLARLQAAVCAFGATVVGVGALFLPALRRQDDDVRSLLSHLNHWQVMGTYWQDQAGVQYRCLCEVNMRLRRPGRDWYTVSEGNSRKVFHPIPHCMEERAKERLNPTRFLESDDEAREFWEVVDEAQAYEHHRRCGCSHYRGFVDTFKMLRHERVGDLIVTRLCERLAAGFPYPEAILIPRKPRAMKLADMLLDLLRRDRASVQPRVIVARQLPKTRAWELSAGDADIIAGRAVLVLDTAAGHGKTVDDLARLAVSANAAGVGAAVLVSRLTKNCETALNSLFPLGFYRVYNFPVRPVVVRGEDPSICPECERVRRVREISERFGMTIDTPRGGLRKDAVRKKRVKPVQPHLWPGSDPFFLRCSSAVASGVVLHALHAATESGLAQFELPELHDQSIPWQTRRSMLAHIPPGNLNEALEFDVRQFLGKARNKGIWIVAGQILAQEGKMDWLPAVEKLLQTPDLRKTAREKEFWKKGFWAKLVGLAGMLPNDDANESSAKNAMRLQFESMLKEERFAAYAPGLRSVLRALGGAA